MSSINNVGGSSPVNPVYTKPVAKPAAGAPAEATRGKDRLELSGLSPLLKTLKAGDDIRADKVAAIRPRSKQAPTRTTRSSTRPRIVCSTIWPSRKGRRANAANTAGLVPKLPASRGPDRLRGDGSGWVRRVAAAEAVGRLRALPVEPRVRRGGAGARRRRDGPGAGAGADDVVPER